MGFILFILYVLTGAILLGVSLKLYAKPKVQDFCEMIGFDDIFESYEDNFVGLCCFYGTLWPSVIAIVIFVFPFAIVKYLYDNKWTKEKEDNDKKSLNI